LNWLDQRMSDQRMSDEGEVLLKLSPGDQKIITDIKLGYWPDRAENQAQMKEILLPLAADYLINAKRRRGKPVDPVARFHLGNGARLENLNWAGDHTAKGLAQSAGMMVNYLYEPGEIEKNHQIYENDEQIVASATVTRLLKNLPALQGTKL